MYSPDTTHLNIKILKHYGQILEHGIRRAGCNLSELAIKLGVNRRTLYNWFLLPNVGLDIIYRIGKIIRHDFSADIPELLGFTEPAGSSKPNIQQAISNDDIWKDKYIDLLEKYNNLLVHATKDRNSELDCCR